AGRQPATAVPGKPKPATEPQAVPPAPTAPVEAAKPAPSPPTAAAPPPVSAPAPAAPAASEKLSEAPQRTVRVIDGVAPVVPPASEARKAAEEPKSDITPPATLE
ncbi:MAG: hypothetical protein ACJ8C9_06775, partial [Microvirga sp.]